jgi:zinc/manganese transport system substrate-binding protein
VVNRTLLTFVALFAVLAGVAGLTIAAGSPKSGRTAGGKLQVVAGTNVYGNIAAQIGGPDVRVTSVLTNPNADPHLFEPGTSTGLAVANAAVAIQNGLGYDAFMSRLEQASGQHQTVITIADALGVHSSNANPHLWYDVPRLPAIGAAIERALANTDPAHAADYRVRLRRFDASLGPLQAEVARIRADHAGAPVAYTEPVPGYLLQAAGLRSRTPTAFARAIEDGSDPTLTAVSDMSELLTQHRVAVLLYNNQAVSPLTTRMRHLAQQSGIPVIGVSETMPLHTTFQRWQLRQAQALQTALGG